VDLQSARELKAAAAARLVAPFIEASAQSLGVRAQGIGRVSRPNTVALGVARSGPRDYRLAVRIQHPLLKGSKVIDDLRTAARGEVDVQYVGSVRKHAPPRLQQRCRPLLVGNSIGHIGVTAGTLGALASPRQGGGQVLLSNNHVFADENKAAAGDPILQSGVFDGGRDPADRVATLGAFVALNFGGDNTTDCAIAPLDDGIDVDRAAGSFGPLRTGAPAEVSGQEIVLKVGRTTGFTRGRVVTTELDNLGVGFDGGVCVFNGQIEVEGEGAGAFSAGGDSGSLVFDEEGRPIGLLFAGSDQGGRNGMGVTYVNPIGTVLEALQIDLVV
jgi:hypothetical protein